MPNRIFPRLVVRHLSIRILARNDLLNDSLYGVHRISYLPEYGIFASRREYGQSLYGSSFEVKSSIQVSPSHVCDVLNALHVSSIRVILSVTVASSPSGLPNMH